MLRTLNQIPASAMTPIRVGALLLCLLGPGMLRLRADVVVNFDSLPASGSPVSGAPLANYLAGFGITLSDGTPGTTVTVYDTRDIYADIPGGPPLVAPSPFNVITQVGSNDPVAYTLNFTLPQDHFSMTRTAVLGTHGSGFAYPEWHAFAYDASGNLLDSDGENAFSTFSDIPAVVFTLDGPGIRSVVIASDNHHFAAVSSVVLDDFTVTAVPTALPEPSTLALAGLSGLGLLGYGWRRAGGRGMVAGWPGRRERRGSHSPVVFEVRRVLEDAP